MPPMAEPTSPPVSTPVVEEPLPATASLAPAPDGDWPKQATDAVVRVVDTVRDKTTGPAVNAAHAAKYGIVAALLALPLGVVLLIMAMRLCESAIHGLADWRGWDSDLLLEPMWLVYLLFGAAFCAVGRWFWRKANRPAKAATR